MISIRRRIVRSSRGTASPQRAGPGINEFALARPLADSFPAGSYQLEPAMSKGVYYLRCSRRDLIARRSFTTVFANTSDVPLFHCNRLICAFSNIYNHGAYTSWVLYVQYAAINNKFLESIRKITNAALGAMRKMTTQSRERRLIMHDNDVRNVNCVY